MDNNKSEPPPQQQKSRQQSQAQPAPSLQQTLNRHLNDNQQPQHQHQPAPPNSNQSQLNQSSNHSTSNPNFDSNVISERVKNLATQIYQELKRIISRCNYDEDILSGLMPLIVRVLESLDLALIENQQLQVELELCKDDNDQLVIMFEKEKAAKRVSDKKLIESEYAYEEERQQYQHKIESLDGVAKMMELKAKNASDQAARLEEKEIERKNEYQKLHDRYTELLKSHCDVVERVRHLVGNQEVANLSSINVPHQLVVGTPESSTAEMQYINTLTRMKPSRIDEAAEPDDRASICKLTGPRDTLKSWQAETELLEDASLVVIEDVLGTGGHSKPCPAQQANHQSDNSSQNEPDRLASSDVEGVDHEKEGENDSIAYTSMEKEFRKLIQDNKDLLNTKNALNVVKDDLIAEVDRLTNEVSMYEQAVEQLNGTKEQMKQKVSLLDAELRKTKEELEKAKQKIRENNEEGVPYAQRKRFGRAEMAKVLMERNEYKEKFMELQDAIKYTELVRANKSESEKRSGLWKFFSNLFGAPPREPLAIGAGPSTLRNVSYHVGSSDYQTLPVSSTGLYSGLAEQTASGSSSIRSTNLRLTTNSDLIVLMDSDLNIDRSRTIGSSALQSSKDGSSRFMNNDQSGYIHAYGWNLPISSFRRASLSKNPYFPGTSSSLDSSVPHDADKSLVAAVIGRSTSLRVPIPQYCRPLTGDSFGMKIWCATAIDLSGGEISVLSLQQSKQEVDSNLTDMTVISSTEIAEQSTSSMVNVSAIQSTPVKVGDKSALKRLEQEVDSALNESDSNKSKSDVNRSRAEYVSSTPRQDISMASDIRNPDLFDGLSSCVWICSTQHSRSKITIIDVKTKPNELLDSFFVPTFLYTIKSIPGCKRLDLPGLINSSVPEKKTSLMSLIEDLINMHNYTFYRIVDSNESNVAQTSTHCKVNQSTSGAPFNSSQEHQDSFEDKSLEMEIREQASETNQSQDQTPNTIEDPDISKVLVNNVSDGIVTLEKLNDFVANTQVSANNSGQTSPVERRSSGPHHHPISTHLPTVWMGGKNSILYVHSAIGQWGDCIDSVKLPDSILQIYHHRGRVFVALADGTLCVFFRDIDTKLWNLKKYLQIDINLLADYSNQVFSDLNLLHKKTRDVSHDASVQAEDSNEPLSLSEQLRDATERQNKSNPIPGSTSRPPSRHRPKVAGIRCIELANKNLWIGYRNRVIIIDPISLQLKHSLCVTPQIDNQIRQLVAMNDGVFCCLRSDLIMRLYSSLKPYQHIHNIDIEPVVTRLLSPRSFVISHITAMKVADNMLWIGNAHGIIITIPCDLESQVSETPQTTTSTLTDSPNSSSGSLCIARSVPKCDISNAQISFHGHKDSVKFFIHCHNLMLSGGQGYLDFRLDMDDQTKSINDKSHLILWQLAPQ